MKDIETEETRNFVRDFFAGVAMQALLSTGEDYRDEEGDGWEWFARAAYSMADAMLAERDKG